MTTTRKRIWVFLDAEVPEEEVLLNDIAAKHVQRRQDYLRRLLLAGHAALSGGAAPVVVPTASRHQERPPAEIAGSRSASRSSLSAAVPKEVLGSAEQLKGLLG